jgi:hypothetical protein
VKPEYGDDTVGKLADALDMPRGTLANYLTVAKAYAPDDRETGNSFTVYEIFAKQDDRMDLLTSKTWSTADARKLRTERAGGTIGPDGDDGDGDGAGDGEKSIDDKIADAAAYVMQLEGQLVAARAKLAKLENERDTTAKVLAKSGVKAGAKVVMHAVKGIPAHPAGAKHPACPQCKADAAKNGTAPRTVTRRKAA